MSNRLYKAAPQVSFYTAAYSSPSPTGRVSSVRAVRSERGPISRSQTCRHEHLTPATTDFQSPGPRRHVKIPISGSFHNLQQLEADRSSNIHEVADVFLAT